MKTKTPFQIQKFIPANESDFAYAGQISDHPDFPAKIGRIILLQKYMVDHTAKRIQLYGCLIHVDLTTLKLSKSFSSELNDWLVSNNYQTVVRNLDGTMQPNPEFIPEEGREADVFYSDFQSKEFKDQPAFDRFSDLIKNSNLSTASLFEKIVEFSDEFDDIFDQYDSIQQHLESKPLNFKNPTV